MSPYLFVLVMEIWNVLLRFRVQNSAEFQYHWKCKELGLINLCFADDVLLFCKAHLPSITIISDTLNEFAALSGLKVNPAKSQIIFSRAVQHDRQQILEYLGFQEGALPIKYLGIPLTSSRLTLTDCRPLFDKVDARLAGWNHLNLSYAGRLQLIKAVLSTLHMYWASAFIIPKGVLKILEKKMRKFLWCGSAGSGNAKVAWERICKPKEEGGLGLHSLITTNQALMLKQLWRIIQNDGTSIWVDWIQHYRLRQSTIWTFNGALGSWGWRKMLNLRPLLQRGVIYKLPPINATAADTISWRSSSGKYSFQAAVSLIQTTTPHVFWHGLLQGKFKIPRHGFILWLAILEKLSTMDKPWVPSAENGCVLCGGLFDETHDHLFFKCWYSKRCLTILKRQIKFQWPYIDWQRGLMWASTRWRGNHLINMAFRATLAALVYHLWGERNNRKFSATSASAEYITSRVLEEVRLRIMAAECTPSLQTHV
ncbi:UNVERIFIED_CONTAM: putative ribonuclease H protein [Sesamum radiatum]|uniref:Ribonuclease H protein n=1 Tax=Sesamum radiatum TaxID=300843 RepID=A0AAW2J240_SESRA